MVELHANAEEPTMETREASPAHLLIKIESFSLFSKLGIQKYESREFVAGGYKWRLIIYPSGLIASENDHISAYVTIIETSSMPVNWEVNAIFSIFLYNQVLDKFLCFQGKTWRFHNLKPQWGFSKLISKESFSAPSNGFLVDDNCVFGAEVSVVNKSERFTECVSMRETAYPYKREWKISNFSKLGNFWYSQEFTAADHKWKISLYPNGNGKDEGRNVDMFLESVSSEIFAPHEKVNAEFRLHIKDQFHDRQKYRNKMSHWFTCFNRSYGCSFLPISYIHNPHKGYIVNDCCIVEVQVSVQAVVR